MECHEMLFGWLFSTVMWINQYGPISWVFVAAAIILLTLSVAYLWVRISLTVLNRRVRRLHG